jgi:hypothetical protein
MGGKVFSSKAALTQQKFTEDDYDQGEPTVPSYSPTSPSYSPTLLLYSSTLPLYSPTLP